MEMEIYINKYMEIEMNLNSLSVVRIPHHDFYISVWSITFNILLTHHSMLGALISAICENAFLVSSCLINYRLGALPISSCGLRLDDEAVRVAVVKLKVNFEIYLADRKATTCI